MAPRPLEDPEKLHGKGGHPPILTWDKFQKVCASLALHGGKYKACEANHVGYSTVRQAIQQATERGDDAWQELWDESYEQFRESLEQSAITRHVDGVTTSYYDKEGNHTHDKTEYSDRMGELLLKGHFPERFRDKLFVSGTVGLEPVDAFANLTPRAKREIRAIIMRDLEEQRQAAEAAYQDPVIEGELVTAPQLLQHHLEEMRKGDEDEQ